MIVFPNCKINLGLRILRKRTDGFHDLETIFYPIFLDDVLEIIQENKTDQPEIPVKFSSSGHLITGSQDNLCVKAYELLRKDFPKLPAVQMHLHKNIPVGAGLGGGSSDAAFTLKLLNEQFHLNLATDRLCQYALQLGSDCPFFIINQPCYATGRGEVLEPLHLDLSAYKFIIVNPGIPIQTAKAFSIITPALPATSVKQIIQQPVESWKNELFNDFEIPIFQQHPEIELLKKELYDRGAIYAAMTGSGSTVFGIVAKEKSIPLDFPSHYFVRYQPAN